MSEALRLEFLSVPRGGHPFVREVSMEIPPGQVTALLGANGAGKSTLVLAVGGVLRPSAGRVLLGERELTGMRPEKVRASGVAVIPEGRRLLTDLTVQENLRVATYALSRADAAHGIKYALELFPELEKRWDIQARLLSGGEQQMLVLAQALVSACCETTAVLDFGKLIASGPTAEVLRNEHVIRAYLGTEEEL